MEKVKNVIQEKTIEELKNLSRQLHDLKDEVLSDGEVKKVIADFQHKVEEIINRNGN